MKKILIVTSDFKFFRNLNYQLSILGHLVEVAHSRPTALRLISEIDFQLILLDNIEEPRPLNEICSAIKNQGCRAALVLMSDHYEDLYMQQGIDDFIIKPFSVSDCCLVINKQLERKSLENKPLVLGELKIDLSSRLAYVQEKLLTLGRKELEVLIILTKKAGRISRPGPLLTAERIYGLKKKLQNAAGETLQIKFIKGLGYKLIAQGT